MGWLSSGVKPHEINIHASHKRFARRLLNAARNSIAENLQGLWQFPNRGVWVRINADGSAFQCRVARNEELIVASGRFTKPGSIVWDKEWERDDVVVVADGIRLDGKFGKFTFARATDPMNTACLAAEAAA